jgi:chromosome partitioning protein
VGLLVVVARIICIANQKGGVGKTTTAVNLSAVWALAGHSTLLVDLDPQGSASSGVGAATRDGSRTIYDVLVGSAPVADVVQQTQISGLTVIPSSRDLTGAEIELVPMLAREHRLSEALAPVRERVEFIVVDCPPSLGLLTLNGLTAADSVLIPLQCEYYALEGLSALIDTVELIRRRLNPRLSIEGVLLTMFDSRNTLSHQVTEEVRRHFPKEILETVIPRNVRLSEAPSHGLPAVIYDASSRGAQAYQALGEELLQRAHKSAAAGDKDRHARGVAGGE